MRNCSKMCWETIHDLHCLADFLYHCFCLFLTRIFALAFYRMTFLRHIFPFDDAIGLHKLLGSLGFVFAVIHSLCHVVDVWRWGDPGRRELFFLAFPDETRQPTHFELLRSQVAITGMGMLSIYSIVFLTASNWPRRSPWLQETRLGAVILLRKFLQVLQPV